METILASCADAAALAAAIRTALEAHVAAIPWEMGPIAQAQAVRR